MLVPQDKEERERLFRACLACVSTKNADSLETHGATNARTPAFPARVWPLLVQMHVFSIVYLMWSDGEGKRRRTTETCGEILAMPAAKAANKCCLRPPS